MADEKERKDSYTRLFNPILDALCKQSNNLSAAQFAIILFIIRSTYGWHKKFLPMSKSFIANGTGLSERCVTKNINILVKKKFVLCYGVDKQTRSKIYGLNKHYSQWGEGEQSDSVQPFTLSLNGQVCEGERNGTFEGEPPFTQKIKSKKERLKKKNKKKCPTNDDFFLDQDGNWQQKTEG